MESDNQENNYCEDDGEYRVSCKVCDNFCVDRYH